MATYNDSILEMPLMHEHIKLYNADPSSGKEGQQIINTTSNTLKMWYSGSWHTIATFSVASALLLESGDYLLLESGNKLLLEA